MRRVVPITALLYAIVAAAPAASSVQPSGFAFGRIGGNIRPYTVTIANSGEVRTSGAVTVGRKRVTSAQLVALNRVATETTFVMLPRSTNCAGTLPDIAATYVRVGARTVRVHGNCVPRYTRMWKALVAAVRVSQ
ncbi:MAG TPA: hypothetical protein VGN27_09470 [Gaiellaceae bacterium]|jgi:hypothetical protein|nr:hypothetical protein [Gaiellaceae bacterium]